MKALPQGLFVLTALATLTMAAGRPAHAQTLSLTGTDALTVTGTGTVGTKSGSAVNTTKTYTDSETTAIQAVETAGASTFTLGPGGTLTDVNDGAGLYAHGSGLVRITGGTLDSGGAGQYGTSTSILPSFLPC